MNTALILAGGLGSRINSDVPKQYCIVDNKPIISYCLKVFEENENISSILIVAEESWHCFLQDWIIKENITKFCAFAKPGTTRSLSILSGLNKISEISGDTDLVVVHDAARPLVSRELIDRCI
ncbi:MAG: 4-diphosphocytidyl-2-C-methyl-D-erythritol synthase, partial [Firmicutes bacterium]|nr:4-diphosphocytidyl-2-C-methyl-D-erythritol synthase [Bacillota bacterium]